MNHEPNQRCSKKKHVEIIHGSGLKNVGAQGTIARLSQVLIQETLKGLEPGGNTVTRKKR